MTTTPASGRRRVLLLIDNLGNGGAEREFALLADYLPPSWQRRVWALDGGPFADVIRSKGIRVDIRRRAGRLDARPALDLGRTIARWRPDIVHSWGWMSTLAAGPVCRLMGIPLIDGTIRNGMVPVRRGRLNQLSMRWAARVIANSRAGLNAYDLGAGRGRIVYNGLDPARLRLCSPAEDRPQRPLTAIMTARMAPAKDYQTLLAAAAELGDGDWRLVAVGDGPERPRLLREADGLIARGLMAFPEPSLEVLPLVRQAHAGVLLSDPALHAEGCSHSIMEYMACGLPVVCSESGGNREIVVDGETGFVIPPRDPPALADRLRWLAAHPSEAREMGERGRARILRDFTVEAMIGATTAVYDELLAERGRGAARATDQRVPTGGSCAS